MASFSVVSNISAANAQANLQTTNTSLQRTITRLSSGFRINQAGDDAAGLAVANTFRSTQAVLSQGIRNANDGLSQLQIKDGALSNIGTLLDRLATLATQAGSGASNIDRNTLNTEFASVLSEIDREASVANLSGTGAANFSVFISNDNSTQGTTSTNGMVTGTISMADTTSLGIASLTIDSVANALTAIDKLTKDYTADASAVPPVTGQTSAVTALGQAQSSIGLLQNRLQFAISLASSQLVSNKAAESRIRDANVAEESANLTRYQILTQSGIAALAQANQQSSSVLSLLR
jgi:flagellin